MCIFTEPTGRGPESSVRAVFGNVDGPPTWWIVPGVVAKDLQLKGRNGSSAGFKAAEEPEWTHTVGDIVYYIKISRRCEQCSYILWVKKTGEDKSQLLEVKFDDKSKHAVLEFLKGQGKQFVDGKATRQSAKDAKAKFLQKNASESGGDGSKVPAEERDREVPAEERDGAALAAKKRPAADAARAARKRPASCSADQDAGKDKEAAAAALKRPAAASATASSTNKRPAAVSQLAKKRPAAAPDVDQHEESSSESSSDVEISSSDKGSKRTVSPAGSLPAPAEMPDIPQVPRLLSELGEDGQSSAD